MAVGTATSGNPLTIRPGERDAAGSTRVRDAQTALNAWRTKQGLPPLNADGVYGPKMAEAVRAFQAANGAQADGVLGPKTQALLTGFSGTSSFVPTADVGSIPTPAPTGTGSLRPGERDSGGSTRIRDAQVALNAWRARSGLPALSTDGSFGPQMTEAVRQFQASAGLTADGVLGAKSLAKLQAAASGESTFTPVQAPAGGAPLSGAPTSYDVGSISAGELARLPGPLATVIREAKSTYASQIASGARVLALTSAGNGGAPVLAIAAPGFNPSLPVTAHTHYHGWRTSVGHAGGSHTSSIKRNLAADPQRVYVLPECRSKDAQGRTDWSNAANQSRTTRDALAALGVSSASRHVVSAHSAGGKPLARFMENGTLQADQLRMLDCLYWDAQQKAAIRANPGKYRDVVIVVTPDQAARGQALKSVSGGRLLSHGDHEGAVRDHMV